MAEENFTSTIVPLDNTILNELSNNIQAHKEDVMSLFFSNMAECTEVVKNNAKVPDYEKFVGVCLDMIRLSQKVGALELEQTCKSLSKVSESSFCSEIPAFTQKIDSDLQKIKVFLRNTGY